MINIYLIRHAECTDNVAGRIPRDDSPLSLLGEDQALLLSNNIKKLPVEYIWTSHMLRTKQTANILCRASPWNIKIVKDIGERKFPDIMLGKIENTPEVKKVFTLMRKNAKNADWHYENEENFIEFRNRIEKILKTIIARKKNMVIVTHAGVIRMIRCLIQNKGSVSYDYYVSMRRKAKIPPCSLTHVTVTEENVYVLKNSNNVFP